MNRYRILLAVLMVFLTGAATQAQDPPQTPQAPPQRGGGAADPLRGGDILNLIGVLGTLQQTQPQTGQPANAPGAPRGGGRGARNGGPGTNANNPDLVGEIRPILAPVDTTITTGRGLLVSPNSGAWWTNTTLLTRLGLTDDQKLKIERVFENNRQNLTTSKDTLEKEEAQLARLLDAEPLDRGGVTMQIYKVVQARGEMEKINALMTLEMREVLTRAQWMQLQVQQSVNVSVGVGGAGGGGLGVGLRGAGGRGPGGFGPGGTPPGTTAPAGTGGQRSGRGQ